MLHHPAPSRFFISPPNFRTQTLENHTLSLSITSPTNFSLSLSRAYFSLTVCASHRAGAENASSSSSCQTDQKGTLFAATRAAGQTRRGKTLRFSPRPYGSGGEGGRTKGEFFPNLLHAHCNDDDDDCHPRRRRERNTRRRVAILHRAKMWKI